MAPAGLLVLRMALAILFAAHAAHWLFGAFSSVALGPGGLAATAARLAETGLRPAFPFVVIGGLVQLIGSGLLVVGFHTRWAALGLAGVELVRLAFVSLPWGFFLNWILVPDRGHGIEHGFLLLAALACLIFAGAGEWSLDGVKERSRASRAAGLARVRDHV